MRYASSCAERKRDFDNRCPPRCHSLARFAARSFRKTTITSVPMAPFFVAPNERTPTPARQVRSAGAQPSTATAFAKRAPRLLRQSAGAAASPKRFARKTSMTTAPAKQHHQTNDRRPSTDINNDERNNDCPFNDVRQVRKRSKTPEKVQRNARRPPRPRPRPEPRQQRHRHAAKRSDESPAHAEHERSLFVAPPARRRSATKKPLDKSDPLPSSSYARNLVQ